MNVLACPFKQRPSMPFEPTATLDVLAYRRLLQVCGPAGFLPYSDVYYRLGTRLGLRREETRMVLHTLKSKGLARLGNRGVWLSMEAVV